MRKIGDKKKFNEPQKGWWELKEIIEDAKLALEWTWFRCTCPHCQREINEVKVHQIYMIEVWENDKGHNIMLGYTIDGRYMRLPDNSFHKEKNMITAVKKKSKYMKKRKVVADVD